jgi:TPR repeat protein
MKIIFTIALIFLCWSGFCIGPDSARSVAPNPLNNISGGITPEQSRANELYVLQQQQARAQELARQQAEREAAAKAELDETTRELTGPRDQAIAQLTIDRDAKIAALNSQMQEMKAKSSQSLDDKTRSDADTLKQLAKGLKQVSSFEKNVAEVENDFTNQCAIIRAECDKRLTQLPEIIARKNLEKAKQQKQAMADMLLKRDQELAAHGDVYGLLRMGQRCRDAENVPRDLTQAKKYLQQAADAGSSTAMEELKNLQPN